DHIAIMMPSFGIVTIVSVNVMIASGIDLAYGISKSHQKGEYTHSNGLRMTATKLITYLSFILIGFLIDAINPMFVYWDIPQLPLVSIIAGIYLVITEFISIREHVSKGMRKKIRNTPKEVKDMLKEIREVTDEIKEIKK